MAPPELVTGDVKVPKEKEANGITLDEFRTKVKEITSELEAKEPAYAKTICAITGLKKIHDLRTILFVAYYFWSTYVLWNWNSLFSAANIDTNSSLMWLVYAAFLWSNYYFSFLGSAMTHNTMHSPLFKGSMTYANKITQLILTLTYGHPVSSYVPGHNLSHHKFTQSKKDIMSTHLMQHKSNLYNLIFFQPSVALSVLQSDCRYIVYQKERGNHIFVNQTIRELLLLIVVQGVLMCNSLGKFFMYFYLPHLFAQYMIVTLSMLQHDSCDEFVPGQKYINFNTSRNFTSPFLNFFTLNNGYHTIHHLVPTSHWSVNKVLHDRLVLPHIDSRLDEPSMAAFVMRNYVYNGNPWNANTVVMDYKNEPALKFKLDFGAWNKAEASNLKYVEWLNFPAGFNAQKHVPMEKSSVFKYILLLVVKLAISPVYSVDPSLKLI